MQLFYVPEITTPIYILPEEESGHCLRVLRLSVGDEIYLTDGGGSLYKAVIEQAHPKHCEVRITETLPEYGKRNYYLTMAVAPTKNMDRFEWFIEKATETGVDNIIPILCRHSERRVMKNERAERIIVSAMKQSQKAYLPHLDALTPVEKVLGTPFDGKKLIAHCRPAEHKPFIGDVISKGDSVMVLIGPEGDFSDEEVEAARRNGFTEVSLGRSRLRTETAALSAVTMVSFINNMNE